MNIKWARMRDLIVQGHRRTLSRRILSTRAHNLLHVIKQEHGGAVLELYLTIPILMIMITGVFSIGTLLQQNIELTDSVNVGAMLFATQRNQTLDPCTPATSAIKGATPFLDPNLMTITYTINGTSYAGPSCSSSSYSSGAAGSMVSGQGQPASVTVTYPCSIAIYGTPVVPGCTLTATLTEIVQ